MGEMIERVARSLYEFDASNSSVRWESWPADMARCRKALRIKCGKYCDRARAVIDAMRVPTSEMIQAGEVARGYHTDVYFDGSEVAKQPEGPIYVAMIDAALSSEQEK